MYFVTVFKVDETDDMLDCLRVIGYFHKLKDAKNAIKHNAGDIHEDSYNYAVIEDIEEGIYPVADKIQFYWFNGKKYEEAEPPYCADTITNFAL